MPKKNAKLRSVFIGMSGWTYPPWRGTFYPKGLVQKKELLHASQQVSAIEVNGTFYSLQKPATFKLWHDQTPEGFRFGIKAPQFITHIKRVKDVDKYAAYFLASGLLELGHKLGAILWQFPPNMILKDDRFEIFMKNLPKNSDDLAKAAHDLKMKDAKKHTFEVDEPQDFQHAFEFRHNSFHNDDFLAIMKSHNIAAVYVADMKKIDPIETQTADFSYFRMHGDDDKYKKGYSSQSITALAKKITKLAANQKDIYAFFSTEAKEFSPFDAQKLMKKMTR